MNRSRIGRSALATSRRFCDTVMAKTPRGRRYTQLYYRFAREAVQAMMLHPSLILRSREIMQSYMPVVAAIVKGERPTLTQGDLAEIDGFLNAFAASGSPDLRETIKGLCQDIRDPQVHAEFGLTVTEGPKREAPAAGDLQSFKQMSGLTTFFGLCALVASPQRASAAKISA